jgi:hypothetical protein
VPLPPVIEPDDAGLSDWDGSTAGGETVTIYGENFQALESVTFDGVPVLSFSVNGTFDEITVVTPPHAAGTADVTVTTAAGSDTADDPYTYIAASPPTITDVTADTGYTTGGNTVTITGTNFTGATEVEFDSVPSLSFVVISSTEIEAIVPPIDAADTVDITVTTFAGTSANTSDDDYTYTEQPEPTLTSLSPTSGPTAGGQVVTITGTEFENVLSVFFGDIPVTYDVLSDTSIEAISPPHIAGTVDVIVTTLGGSSEPSGDSQYTFTALAAPSITSLSPDTGTSAGGTTVTITGTRFNGASSVLFGNIPAHFFIASDVQIIATSPAQAASTVHVTITTPTGTSEQTEADEFVYTSASAPTVTDLDVDTGPTSGNTPVLITGTNFIDATSVMFGTVAASFTVVNSTTIAAFSPAQAAGTIDITVTTNAGTSATSSADEFEYTAASDPVVTSISPDTGPQTGGTTVVIIGSNFTAATSVLFGDEEAYFSVLADDTILAYAPPGSGTVHVTVTTDGGTSSTSSADEFVYTSVSAPTLTNLDNDTGSSNGGTIVVITGTNLADTFEVLFGTASAFFVVNSDTQVTAISPANAAGTIDVTLTTPAGSTLASEDSRFSYTLADVPAITSLDVDTGSTAGGTTVVITGTDFAGATSVVFGDAPAQFSIDSPTQITAVSPGQAAATVHIRVANNAGISEPVSDDLYTYSAASAPTVTSLATDTGSTAGGTLVAVTGTNFTAVTSVKFGTLEASFTPISSTLLIAWSPPQAAGTVHVTVTTDGGTSSTSSADEFDYSAASAPAVTGLNPDSGPTTGGTSVLIIGSNFTSATAVTFGGIAATFDVLSDEAILAISPLLAAATVDVRVTTAGGTSSIVSADEFTYTNVTTSAPAVTDVSPDTGATAGGMIVIITGTNFAGATGVSFGATAATSFTIDSDTQITAVAPAGSAATVDIRVATNNGTSSIVSADEFTYLSAAVPAVSSLGTSSGSTAGGTSVTLTGTDFTSVDEVLFGSVSASFTVNSSTSITATAPAQYAGVVNVTVTTPSGTSAGGGGNQFTYNAASAPVITSLGTSSGTSAGGTSVTINGTDLGGTLAVYFDGVAAENVVIVSGSELTVDSPAHTAGTFDVIVVTTAGTSSVNDDARFTFSAADAPELTTLGTDTGSSAGGTSVVITGTDLLGATAVFFGDVNAEFTIDSSTQITAISPAQSAGTVNVVVWTTSGSSPVDSAGEFTYSAASAPAVSGLATDTGSTAGGTTVVITGTNFTAATQVMFGSVPADSFAVDSATQMLATAL